MVIVTPSEWLANFVKKSFLGEYPIKVINNGIDIEKFVAEKGVFRKKYDIMVKVAMMKLPHFNPLHHRESVWLRADVQ